MTIINVHDAESQLSQLIERAVNGEEVVIAEAGKPMVKLTPLPQGPRKRVGGQARGKVWMSEDFDQTPGDVLAAFEGESK